MSSFNEHHPVVLLSTDIKPMSTQTQLNSIYYIAPQQIAPTHASTHISSPVTQQVTYEMI
jgi:hypothetical protein